MGSWFRSEPMELRSMLVREHVAHEIIEELGELGIIQFTDMQGDVTAFKREYTPFVRRCTELEGILKEYRQSMEQYNVSILPRNYQEYQEWRSNLLTGRTDRKSLLEILEDRLKDQHATFKQSIDMRNEFAPQLYSLIEQREVVRKAKEFYDFERGDNYAHGDVDDLDQAAETYGLTSQVFAADPEHGRMPTEQDRLTPLMGDISSAPTMRDMEYRFQHIAGVIKQEDKLRFERMVARTSKRQAYVRFADVERELVDENLQPCFKSVFVIFYRLPSLESRLMRMCDSFGRRHAIPEFSLSAANRSKVVAEIQELDHEITRQLNTLKEWKKTLMSDLERFSTVYEYYRMAVTREKAVYHALNMFERSGAEMLHMRGWVLKEHTDKVLEVLRRAHTPVGGGAPLPYFFDPVPKPWPAEPTFFYTNKFTSVFQSIVDTYGVPRYREANPALFTAATFPFLYGVMYGDVGHAGCIFVASLLFVLFEKKLQKTKLNEMVSMVFSGRYMILMMAFFGIYCGFIYNDCFGIGVETHSSYWHFPSHKEGAVASRIGNMDDVYPFGIDVAWHTSSNKLLFLNSLKMKLSIVLGVTQMTFGIFLKALNGIYFKDYLDFFSEAIPQIIFMLSLFGYMVFLIIYKWCVDWSAPSSGSPPGLIDQMIGIVLSPGSVKDPMFSGQANLHTVLLLIAFACVPCMLLLKPYVLWKRNKHSRRPRAVREHGPVLDSGHGHMPLTSTDTITSEEDQHGWNYPASDPGQYEGSSRIQNPASTADVSVDVPQSGKHEVEKADVSSHEEEEFSLGDIFVHQSIETIEFVLGAVSNTASYLRLWALSLAHSQLAAVFYDKALKMTIETENVAMVFVGYAVFAGVTFGVLLVMDVLECFLHALRLHWVEFQNKFFKADGYKFEPFWFDRYLQEEA